MRLSAAALILCLIPPQDTKTSKDPDVRRVTVKAENFPVGKVVADLMQQTGIPIEYDDEVKKKLESDKGSLTLDLADLTLTDVLRLLFQPYGFKVVAVDKKKVLIASQ